MKSFRGINIKIKKPKNKILKMDRFISLEMSAKHPKKRTTYGDVYNGIICLRFSLTPSFKALNLTFHTLIF